MAVEFQLEHPAAVTKYSIGPEGIVLYSGDKPLKPISTTFQKLYSTQKGKSKTLHEIPVSKGNPLFSSNPEIELCSKYDEVIVIDTNTKQIDDAKTISVYCKLALYVERNGIVYFKGTLPNSIKYHLNLPKNQEEKFAIQETIKEYTSKKIYIKRNIAIVTDHDKNSHSAINARRSPLRGAFFLPDGFTLLYASSDKKNDGILNEVIFLCDKISSEFIEHYLSNTLSSFDPTRIIDARLRNKRI